MSGERDILQILDDDPSVLLSLGRLFKAHGYEVRTYSSAEEYLESAPNQGPACLLLDLQLPGMDGLDVQKWVNPNPLAPKVVFISGYGDVPRSVQAMRQGAIDFLTKPIAVEALLRAVQEAFERSREAWRHNREELSLEQRLACLTQREREVWVAVTEGKLNKQIAHEMGISLQTVKVHRGRVMRKLGVASLAELIRATTSKV